MEKNTAPNKEMMGARLGTIAAIPTAINISNNYEYRYTRTTLYQYNMVLYKCPGSLRPA